MNETPHGSFLSRLGAKLMERLGADDGPPVEYIHSSEYERRKAKYTAEAALRKSTAEAEREAKAEARKSADRGEAKGGTLVALFSGFFEASKVVNRYFKDARGTVYQYRASGMIVRAVRKNSKERRRRDLRAICLRHARPGKPVHRLMHEARSFTPALPTGAQPEDRAA